MRSTNVCIADKTPNLPGALSSDSCFGVLRPIFINGRCQFEDLADVASVMNFVGNEFEIDFKNNVFVKDNSAVAAAYDFSELDEQETAKEMANIMLEKRSEFMDYDFEFVEGQFPVDVIPGRYNQGKGIGQDRAIMSTHVLLIKNYEKHLVDSNKKSKSL